MTSEAFINLQMKKYEKKNKTNNMKIHFRNKQKKKSNEQPKMFKRNLNEFI